LTVLYIPGVDGPSSSARYVTVPPEEIGHLS
jgi:hypothetical protein